MFAKLFLFPIYDKRLEDDQHQMADNNGMEGLYLNVYILFPTFVLSWRRSLPQAKRTDFRLSASTIFFLLMDDGR